MECLNDGATQALFMETIDGRHRYPSFNVDKKFFIYMARYILVSLYLYADNGNKIIKIRQYMKISIIFLNTPSVQFVAFKNFLTLPF